MCTIGVEYSRVTEAVRHRLGIVFDELVAVMTDLGTPPLFVLSDDRPRLAIARRRALALLGAWAADSSSTVELLLAQAPPGCWSPNPSDALLEIAVWGACPGLEPSVFRAPDAESRVFTALPSLWERLDDDGLLDVTGLQAGPHGLEIEGFSLHYHQLLRRHFSSNIHYDLIGAVLGYSGRYGLRARLAIDERRLRYAHEHEEFLERDYWWGRPFNGSRLDDPHAVGETFHGDASGGSSFLNPYAGLSVRWTSDGTLKAVEVEEFVPPYTEGATQVLARYCHAIRDTSAGAFIHCDGAVKTFAAAGYPTIAGDFAGRGRGDAYRKVFRVDGQFPTDVWADLLSLWFRGNTLVLEYLDGRAAG